jgi:hypothetical protein
MSEFRYVHKVKRVKTDDYDQFKFGDNSLVKYNISKHTIIYGDYITQIGLHSNNHCVCSSTYLNIRNTFFCDSCKTLHQYKCSQQDKEELIENDYFMPENSNSYCLSCKPPAMR